MPKVVRLPGQGFPAGILASFPFAQVTCRVSVLDGGELDVTKVNRMPLGTCVTRLRSKQSPKVGEKRVMPLGWISRIEYRSVQCKPAILSEMITYSGRAPGSTRCK
jgi:hypothetical protein